jgi:hypothetical protein
MHHDLSSITSILLERHRASVVSEWSPRALLTSRSDGEPEKANRESYSRVGSVEPRLPFSGLPARDASIRKSRGLRQSAE